MPWTAATIVLLGASVSTLEAQDRSLFRDPDDGAFDLSAWLATPAGFMPLIIPVTEPALEYGGAVGLTFFHRPAGWDIDEARSAFEERQRLEVPSVSAVFGMYTGNKSWAAGAAHRGVWRDGRWRYSGAFFVNSLNLSVAGEVPGGGEMLFDYSLDGWVLSQGLRYRLGDSDFYVGGLYNLIRMEAAYVGDPLPGAEDSTEESTLSSLGVSVTYDARNSTFTTDRGVLAKLEWKRFIEAIGSDHAFGRLEGSVSAWHDPFETFVFGARIEAMGVGDGAPFWVRPSVGLRGIAAGRYAGERAGSFDSEIRWDVTNRWSAVGFGGAGWYLEPAADGNHTAWVGSGGVGFRYLIARAFGLRGGLDFAYGKDGFAFYFTTGSAWPSN